MNLVPSQLETSISAPAFPPSWAEVFGEDGYGIFAEFRIEAVRFVWRWIPPGTFQMGSPKTEAGRWDDEGPQHWVRLSNGFWLGEAPVTQAQWAGLMGDHPSHFKGDQRPVEQVDWHQCVELAWRLRGRVPGFPARLPTEAEWEYACRAGTQGAFQDGSRCTQPEGHDPALEPLGWFDENSQSETHDVKGKRPNAWGLYDLHGNVFEWCFDGWRDYAPTPEVDPLGPTQEGASRVVRGGSWGNSARYCRAAYRSLLDPGGRWDGLGLRLAAGPEPGGGSGSGATGGGPGRPGLRDEAP